MEFTHEATVQLVEGADPRAIGERSQWRSVATGTTNRRAAGLITRTSRPAATTTWCGPPSRSTRPTRASSDRKIVAALEAGQQAGPDGKVSRWTTIGELST